MVWLSGHYHVGLGRFDQYMWPYLEADLRQGRLDVVAAEELLAEFFIALNKDSDLYPGVQQGDNGQSLTIGGVRPDGTDGVNPLTRMVLRVAHRTAMIDPKINLRMSPDTDLELSSSPRAHRKGSFPQYSNDAIPSGLVSYGTPSRTPATIRWPRVGSSSSPAGMEVVNIGAVSFPPPSIAASARLPAGRQMRPPPVHCRGHRRTGSGLVEHAQLPTTGPLLLRAHVRLPEEPRPLAGLRYNNWRARRWLGGCRRRPRGGGRARRQGATRRGRRADRRPRRRFLWL